MQRTHLFLLALLGFFCLSEAKVVFNDQFNGIYDPLSLTSKYYYAYFNPFTTTISNTVAQGKLTQSINPFTATAAQGPLGGLDHVKTLQFLKDVFLPGAKEKVLKATISMSVTTYGNEDHPFPEELVTNPSDDLRLGSCSFNAIDEETMIVADFFMTNEGLYAYYERLPFARTQTNFYRAFSQAKRVGDRSAHEFHTVGVVYDKKCRTLSWLLDDDVVFRVNIIGFMSNDPDVVTLLDQGGTETRVAPNGFKFGFGCFTLLDMNDYWNPTGTGLVMIGDNNLVEYYNPSEFWDTSSLLGHRLWGQGAQIRVNSLKVESS